MDTHKFTAIYMGNIWKPLEIVEVRHFQTNLYWGRIQGKTMNELPDLCGSKARIQNGMWSSTESTLFSSWDVHERVGDLSVQRNVAMLWQRSAKKHRCGHLIDEQAMHTHPGLCFACLWSLHCEYPWSLWNFFELSVQFIQQMIGSLRNRIHLNHDW